MNSPTEVGSWPARSAAIARSSADAASSLAESGRCGAETSVRPANASAMGSGPWRLRGNDRLRLYLERCCHLFDQRFLDQNLLEISDPPSSAVRSRISSSSSTFGALALRTRAISLMILSSASPSDNSTGSSSCCLAEAGRGRGAFCSSSEMIRRMEAESLPLSAQEPAQCCSSLDPLRPYQTPASPGGQSTRAALFSLA